MITKIVGYTFFLMCPFIGGIIPFILAGHIFEWDWRYYFLAWTLLWTILFMTWFDDSKYQRVL